MAELTALRDAHFSAKLEIRMLQDALAGRLPSEAAAVTSEMVELRVAVARLQRELEQKNDLLSKSKTAIASLNANADVAAAKVKLASAADNQIASLNATVGELKDVVNAQAARIAAFEAAEAAADNETGALNTRVTELTMQVAYLEAQVADARTSADAASANSSAAAAQLAGVQADLERAAGELDEARLSLEMTKAENSHLVRELDAARAVIDELNSQHGVVGARDSSLLSATNSLRSALLAAQAEFATELERAREESATAAGAGTGL